MVNCKLQLGTINRKKITWGFHFIIIIVVVVNIIVVVLLIRFFFFGEFLGYVSIFGGGKKERKKSKNIWWCLSLSLSLSILKLPPISSAYTKPSFYPLGQKPTFNNNKTEFPQWEISNRAIKCRIQQFKKTNYSNWQVAHDHLPPSDSHHLIFH